MGSIRRWVRGNLIGSGSFGKVNLAINVATGELFAVKSIDCSNSAEAAAMENEARFLQSLDSPFIIRCFGRDETVENEVGMRNLFMEYMAGGSLADLMRKFGGALDEALIRVYTRGIVEGLSYLHSHGVVHCDVKGKNILIGEAGVKIADLGSAKQVMQEQAGQNTVLRGTPLWMAPEAVLHLQQSFASDIWSLGCTVVEMATGRPPWSQLGLNLFATLIMQTKDSPTPPLPDRLSAQGKDFLSRCLQKDPAQRWTAAQLLTHPFVQRAGEDDRSRGFSAPQQQELSSSSSPSSMKVPLSPTSVLVDLSTGCTGSWEAGKPISCATTGVAEAGQRGRRQASGSSLGAEEEEEEEEEEQQQLGRWITVRSPRVGGEGRQRPLSEFMLSREVIGGGGGGGGGREVNLQSLQFLRSRRRQEGRCS